MPASSINCGVDGSPPTTPPTTPPTGSKLENVALNPNCPYISGEVEGDAWHFVLSEIGGCLTSDDDCLWFTCDGNTYGIQSDENGLYAGLTFDEFLCLVSTNSTELGPLLDELNAIKQLLDETINGVCICE